MEEGDFNSEPSRSRAFDWKRVASFRSFNENNKLNKDIVGKLVFMAWDDFLDDPNDTDEDLTPDRDGSTDDLFIWTFDAPSVIPSDVSDIGKIDRIRWNFDEFVNYAGVLCSAKRKWYWRASVENPLGGDTFVQNNDVTNDNSVDTGETPKTWNLLDSTVPDFTLTGRTPATHKQTRLIAPIASLPTTSDFLQFTCIGFSPDRILGLTYADDTAWHNLE